MSIPLRTVFAVLELELRTFEREPTMVALQAGAVGLMFGVGLAALAVDVWPVAFFCLAPALVGVAAIVVGVRSVRSVAARIRRESGCGDQIEAA